jgi:hypothetical protein
MTMNITCDHHTTTSFGASVVQDSSVKLLPFGVLGVRGLVTALVLKGFDWNGQKR